MPDQSTNRRLCLVLEDNWLIAEGLKSQLLDHGFERVEGCKSCQEAFDFLAKIAPQLPDLVLLDVSLDGGETSLAIAHALAETQTPFVVISGHGDVNAITAEYPHTITLQKPVFDRNLAAMLDALMGPNVTPPRS